MVTRITVPFLDANILDVTVTAWRKAPGNQVQAGEILAELTTDKATFELEATVSGTLLSILAAPKSVVPSGYILGLLGEAGEVDPEAAACNQTLMETYKAAAKQSSSQTAPPSNRPPVQPSAGTTRIRATPRARRLAQEYNLDLAAIQAATGAEVIDEATIQPYVGRK